MRVFEHCDIFDFHKLAFVAWRRVGGDVLLKDGVELRRGHSPTTVFIDLHGAFDDLEDALLGQRRREDDGEVDKGSEAVADSGLVVADGCLRLVFGDVPFVDDYDKTFLVALYQPEDVNILRLYAAGGVDHEYADV